MQLFVVIPSIVRTNRLMFTLYSHIVTFIYNVTISIILSPAVTSSADELGVSLPDEEDYEGAMTAILRLQKTYNLLTEDVAAGKIHNVTARYRMDSADRLTMGRLYMDVEHGAAISWFEMYLNQAELISEGTKKAFKNMMHIYEKVH